jgi:predicted nucleic acid-binding protein
MENIICDTNIWYYLGNENSNPKRINITPELVKGRNLILTGLVIHELCFSENVLKQTNGWLSANNAAIKYSGNKIIQTEFDCILNLKESPFKKEIQSRYNEMFKVVKLSIPTLTEEQISEGLKYFRNIKTETFQYGTDGFKEFREDYFDRFNSNGQRKREIDFFYAAGKYEEATKDFIIRFSKAYLEKNNQDISLIEGINWEEHIFFIKVFSKFQMLYLKGQFTMTNNDWNDLFNMIYVKPAYKYWTEDKRWRDLIESDPTTKSFLFYQ